MALDLDAEDPRRADRGRVAQLARRPPAGRPAPAQRVHGDRRRHRARRARAPRRRSPGWATGSSASASRTRPGARTRSPPRAGSTRPRTTPTRATRSTACSSTRSRAATSAPARRTSGGSPRSRPRSSTRRSPRGCPFNREYGGMLATRSFGGVLVERTFYCRGQTGQQLLLGAYSALQKQVADGQATVHTRHEMLDLVLVDGRARGIVARDLVSGEIRPTPPTRSCSPPAATATSTTCRRTRRAAT